MTVNAVVGLITIPKGVDCTPEAPYIMVSTLVMSTMGLPVKLRAAKLPALLVGRLPDSVVLGVALVTQGDWGQSIRALTGLLTVFRSRAASLGALLRTEILTDPAGEQERVQP